MAKKIGILGAGGWGITLARILAQKDLPVTIWEPVKENYETLINRRESKDYLPGFKIPEEINITHSLKELLSKSDSLIITVRSSFFRKAAIKLKAYYGRQPVLIGTKGLDISTGERMSDILSSEIPACSSIGVLSGPTIAVELSEGKPSAAVVASKNKALTLSFQDILGSDVLRIYTSSDVTGVEIGGAFKNVISIGAGIIDGLELGINTKSAYLTRGLYEMIQIGRILGGKEKTFGGLSGIGDLMTTSFSKYSRNRSFGEAIVRIGKNKYIKSSKMVIEGIPTTKAFHHLAKTLKVEMPITESLYNIIYNEAKPQEEILKLMRRKAKEE